MRWNPYRVSFASIVVASLFINVQTSAADSSCPQPFVPLSEVLMPPPRLGSAETKAELQELLSLQGSRTLDQVKHASSDHQKTVYRFLGGIGINVEHLPPFANHFFDCVTEFTDHEIDNAKAAFMRTRPYKLLHSKLHILKHLEDDDTSSYPSGHAAYGMVVGLLLAEMLPEKRTEVFRRIQDYGNSRLVSGTHFRSDVYAGQIAGAVIVAFLFKSGPFRDEFDQAKSELRNAIGVGP
jgi:acid phosphatase (class A)